jgi:hypothetical protein
MTDKTRKEENLNRPYENERWTTARNGPSVQTQEEVQ